MQLVIITDYRGALRQQLQEFDSLNVTEIIGHLSDAGIQARQVKFEAVANGQENLSNCFIHYTSSQNTGYRPYIDDILFSLRANNQLVPRYEIYRSHENKGFQELEKKRLGMDGLNSFYFANIKGMTPFENKFQYPLVLKPVGGFMSSGVCKVTDNDDLVARLRKMNRPAGLSMYQIKKFIKKHILKNRHFPEMYEDCVYSGPFVLQEFSPRAKEDWKVIVLGDRYYAMRRQVRPGDFRASGSGRFSFERPSDNILNYARKVFQQLDVPMISIDIIEAENQCHLIEFQGLHFGSITHKASPHRFEFSPDGWQQIQQPGNLEEDYSRALAQYLKKLDDTESS